MDRCQHCGKILRLDESPPLCDECESEDSALILADDGDDPTEYEEWQDLAFGGDDTWERSEGEW